MAMENFPQDRFILLPRGIYHVRISHGEDPMNAHLHGDRKTVVEDGRACWLAG